MDVFGYSLVLWHGGLYCQDSRHPSNLMTIYILTIQCGYSRLSIKEITFPVKRPGDYKRADWGLFFSFLNFFFFFFHIIFYYFSQKKTQKKTTEKNNCGRPTGHDLSHPLNRKQTFFYGQPYYVCIQPTMLTTYYECLV